MGAGLVTLALTLACVGAGPGRASQGIDLLEELQLGTFVPAAASDAAARERGALSPAVDAEPSTRTLALSASGTLVAPIEVPTGESVLEFDVRFRGNNGSLSVSILDLLGGMRGAVKIANPRPEWSPHQVRLFSEERAVQLLVFEATLGGGRAGLELRSPRLHSQELEQGTAQFAEPARDGPSTEMPNILIIILDAARADHFGVYGYERDTTPIIDRVAAESLVFRNAFSECPNTSCSIPNLISGLSLADVGPIGDWRRLDDRMVTLAEYLGKAGYHSIGVSANPNNSTTRNTHQGFLDFHEMWVWPGERRRHPERTDPHRLSRRAIDAMRGVPRQQPLLMLHYVPPHEPYAPSPRFDVFGDPAYAGPVHPGLRFGGVSQDEMTLSPADIAEMVALYDGNLRMTDAAVGEVFEAWREHRRWDNAVVLVTADHGEAFFEHGVQGHNSTLYDEMLHVPFILRLPEGEVPPNVETARLTTLSDVVPTILGQVGLEPEERVMGTDLLGRSVPAGSRVIFHRTPGGRRHSVRTLKWKAIMRRNGRPAMLFDLERDPEERTNLISSPFPHHGLVSHGLAALLKKRLIEIQALDVKTEPVELPEDDLRMLRSLGYVK